MNIEREENMEVEQLKRIADAIEEILRIVKKDKQWSDFHATRLNLIQSIESHMESICKVYVYDNVSNQCDSHSLRNESMGTIEMDKLKRKITI